MPTNKTVESPNFDKIDKESGQFTSDAINLLWQSLNEIHASLRRQLRRSTDGLEPKILHISAAASVNDLDTEGASIVSFEGASAQNVTGFRAPETGKTRLLFCQVNGAGTMTFKHNATSETANQLTNSTGADTARATGAGLVYGYINSKWRELART